MNQPDNNSPTNPGSKEVDPALEPCWCRRDTEYLRVKAHMDHGEFGCRERGRYVYCPNCWACGPTYNTDKEAVEGWNKSRRTSTDSAGAMVDKPIDMILFCPRCGTQHIDAEEDETSFRHKMEAWSLNAEWQDRAPSRWTNPPHRSHLCHQCYAVWRPADVVTNGVARINTHGSEDNTWTNSVASPAIPRDEAAQDELVDEVQHRMDQVVEAAVSRPQSNREPHAYQGHPLYPNYCAFAVGNEDYCKREPDNAIHQIAAPAPLGIRLRS